MFTMYIFVAISVGYIILVAIWKDQDVQEGGELG